MDQPTKYSTLLLDLDCLLDTRLGTLLNIDRDLCTRVITAGDSYFNRLEDRFETLSPEEFYGFYHRRNKLVLASSPMTRMVEFIQEFILGTIKNNYNSPFHFIPKILINTAPYKLNKNEQEQLHKSIVHYSDNKAIIEFINTPIAELTPKFINDNISLVLMYEYKDWLEIHSESKALEKCPCTEVGLLVPSIYFNHMPGPQDQKKLQKHKMTPFEALEFLAKPFISLKVVKTSVFSMPISHLEILLGGTISDEPSEDDSPDGSVENEMEITGYSD